MMKTKSYIVAGILLSISVFSSNSSYAMRIQVEDSELYSLCSDINGIYRQSIDNKDKLSVFCEYDNEKLSKENTKVVASKQNEYNNKIHPIWQEALFKKRSMICKTGGNKRTGDKCISSEGKEIILNNFNLDEEEKIVPTKLSIEICNRLGGQNVKQESRYECRFSTNKRKILQINYILGSIIALSLAGFIAYKKYKIIKK